MLAFFEKSAILCVTSNIRKKRCRLEAAAAKRQLDMLNGPIWSKIPRFALPLAATAILGQLFNAADMAVVGNFTGDMRTAAVAAVSANSSLIGLVVNLFVGISLGANVTIAYAIGQHDGKAVSRAVHTAIVLILPFGKPLLSIFNNAPQVIDVGYIRVVTLMMAHIFSLCYEVLSGYLRGFGISLPPAVLTMLGVCGVRLSWIYWVFPKSPTFQTIMAVFPISLAVTALLMLAAVLCCRPSRRFPAAVCGGAPSAESGS